MYLTPHLCMVNIHAFTLHVSQNVIVIQQTSKRDLPSLLSPSSDPPFTPLHLFISSIKSSHPSLKLKRTFLFLSLEMVTISVCSRVSHQRSSLGKFIIILKLFYFILY